MTTNTPEINTSERLFDLVRFMRSNLHRAELISDEEYTWLCMMSPMATSPKGGSPSRQRLEEYDEMRADRDQLRARVSELERERDEARNEFKLYAGWSKWKPGIWLIEHPETGPSATYIGERDAVTEALKRARVAIEQILAAYKLGGGFALVEAIQTEIARQDAAAALAAAETDK